VTESYPEPDLLTVTLHPDPLDSDEVLVTAQIGDVELARVAVHPCAMPDGYTDRVVDLVSMLMGDALRARAGTT